MELDASRQTEATKRRKVRKGTRSCWECKGRKVKCTYTHAESPKDEDSTVCDGCFRRGTECISQELPEQPLTPVNRRRQMGRRILHVEKLVDRLFERIGDGPVTLEALGDPTSSAGSRGGPEAGPEEPIRTGQATIHSSETTALSSPTALSAASPASSQTAIPTQEPSAAKGREWQISGHLLASSLPGRLVYAIVKRAGPIPSFFHQLRIRMPGVHVRIDEEQKQMRLAELTVQHKSRTHPITIARQMLLLAISFRCIHPDAHHDLPSDSESPSILVQRAADAAINFVSANDDLIDTCDGLECLLLAASFQSDNGNLRSAWTLTRRALLTAQLMCLHRHTRTIKESVQPETWQWNHKYLWYRIVFYDRFFSLILGLPQGSTDNSAWEDKRAGSLSAEDDTHMGRLERGHWVLISRILARNDRDPGPGDLLDTQAIDLELSSLAESMPSKWWLLPNLASAQDESELFWDTSRLTNQLLHFILLSHLHLPYILPSSSRSNQEDHGRREYSRVAYINASRDLLSRYRVFRTFDRGSYCCHSMDFLALTASAMLVLAHLAGRCSKRVSDSMLVHQRTSDRGILKEMLDNMEQVGTLRKTKTFGPEGAGVLRELLAIESDAARGSNYRLDTSEYVGDSTHVLRLNIPYLGTVYISKESHASRSMCEDSSRFQTWNTSSQNARGIRSTDEANLFDDSWQPVEDLSFAQDPTSSLTMEQDDFAFEGFDETRFDTMMGETGDILP